MAGFSFRASNALNSGNYSGSDSNAEAAYGIGLSESGYDIKKLEEQLKLQRDQLAANLISQGYGTSSQQSTALRDITGYTLDAPNAPNKLTTSEGATGISNLANLINLQRSANNNYGSEQLAWKLGQQINSALAALKNPRTLSSL